MARPGIEIGVKNIRKLYKNSGCYIQREEPVFFIETNRLIFMGKACVFVNHTVLGAGGTHGYRCSSEGQETARIG